LIRAAGDTLLLSPPLIVTQEQISEMFGVVADVLRSM
jgi:beta-alanine--pyruvate transaminase